MMAKTCSDGVRMTAAEAAMASELLKAISHPLRLRILCLLSEQDLHVTAIATQLDTQPAIISQQLRILRAAKLVASATNDGHAHYRIVEPHLVQMLNCIKSCITTRAKRG